MGSPEVPPTPPELSALSVIDSTVFGYFHLSDPSNAKLKQLLLKAVQCLETFISQRLVDNNTPSQDPIHIQLYCKLGHFYLLLENYSKALSYYQKFYVADDENWKDSTFLYGLGLVYFHYNAYQW